MFRLGLVINPLAGIGGPLGLKGSDDIELVNSARQQGAGLRAVARATEALRHITRPQSCIVYCFAGLMGEQAAKAAGLTVEVVGAASAATTSADDTVAAARRLQQRGVDLLVFVGGDGTARDVYRALGDNVPVLGVPAGVKMHSGVYAVSPQAAGELINQLMSGQLVDVGLAEVRDIDEQAFREGRVQARFYGELLVPREGRFLQQTKTSGVEVEALVLEDIAADLIESMVPDSLYLIGPGTTPRGVMAALGLDNTLLGVDAIRAGQLLGSDLNEQQLLTLIEQHRQEDHRGEVKIIITAIGGQGHILGRGNQQLSPAVIRAAGLENIIIVATKTKIKALQGRPLLVDSNDPQLDAALTGFRQIITGYHDSIMYPVGLHAQDLGDET